MSRRSHFSRAAAFVAFSSVLSAPGFAQVTTRTPVKPLNPVVPTVTISLPPATTSAILHTGSYRLKIHVLPGPDATADIQKETDVVVTVSGGTVAINGARPATGPAALSGTISGNQFTAAGSDAGMHLVIAGTGTAAGVAGTLTVTSATKTAHGTFNLFVMPPSQAHKINEFGTKPAPPPEPNGGFWAWWDSWCIC